MRCTHNPDCPHCHPQRMAFPALLQYLYDVGYTGTLTLDFFSGQPQWVSGSGILKTRILRGDLTDRA